MSACCHVLLLADSGNSVFFLGDFRPYSDNMLLLPDCGSSTKVSGGSEISNLTVTDLDLRVFILHSTPSTTGVVGRDCRRQLCAPGLDEGAAV
jgi:hypothetical protein